VPMEGKRKKLRSWVLAVLLTASTGGLSSCEHHYRPQRTQMLTPPSGSGLGATRRSRREARQANWKTKAAEDPLAGMFDPGQLTPGKKKKAKAPVNPLTLPAPKRAPPQNLFGTPQKRGGLRGDNPFKDL
jgi:hypothetical protein